MREYLSRCGKLLTSLPYTVKDNLFLFQKDLGIERFYILEGIIYSEFLILLLTHVVIRKSIECPQIVELSDEISEFVQIFIIIRKTRNDDVAYPHVYILLLKIEREFQYIGIGLLYKTLMMLIIDMLDIEHYKIGQFAESVIFLHKLGIIGIEHYSRCIETGVDTVLFAELKKLEKEIYLHEGFSAGNGQTAAVLIEALVTVILLEDILCLHIGATRHLPGIRVMTVSASHGAAFEKYNEPCAGSVYGSEAFKRMNVTYHLILLLKTGPKRKLSGPYFLMISSDQIDSWKVLEITSACCSGVNLMKLTAYPETRMVS